MKENKTNLLQDVAAESRAEMLKEIATKTETSKVRRHYTQDEKDQHKDFITAESIGLMDETEQFKAIKKEFDKAAKEKKEAITEALKSVKRGFSENEETVYLIDDQEADIMNIYDKNGIYLSSRPLFPDERQTRIHYMKTGTNE